MSETPGSEHEELEHPESVWRRPILLISMSCLSLLALAGVGTTALVVVNNRNYVNCQRAYNQELVSNFIRGKEAADQDRAALRLIAKSGSTMIDSLLKPGVTVADQRAAVQTWRDDQAKADHDLDEADAKRRSNPLPPPRAC